MQFLSLYTPALSSSGPPDAQHIARMGKLMEEIEREAVALTLKLTNGNQAAAARLLGISRPTLAKKMPPREQPIALRKVQ